jgi:hypothetical protein
MVFIGIKQHNREEFRNLVDMPEQQSALKVSHH